MSTKPNKNSKKQDLAEKVQEIQKRQKNWLKQREEHKKADTGHKTHTSSSEKVGKTSSAISNHGNRNTYNAENTVEKMPSMSTKDNFQSWMEAREKSEKLKIRDNIDDMEQEPDVLKISSSRTAGYATPDPDWSPPTNYSSHGSRDGGQDHRYDAAKSLMSHQDFDEMANKIVARVKNELDIPYKAPSKTVNTYNEYSHEDKGRFRESKSRDRNNYTRGQDQDDLISSHFCPECRELMLSSDHVPMILTPCAHSLCQSCCQGRSLCPQCACTVSSKTVNIMLLQIIQNHHKSKERTNDSRKTYSPDNYREKAKTKQQYHEEYENLQTRQEVLHIESREIQGHMAKLANKIAQQQQQIENIEREEKKVKDKIQSLKEKLVELETHKREYDRAIDEIELERTKDKNKLNMVQDTLASIEIEMEKLRVLTEGR